MTMLHRKNDNNKKGKIKRKEKENIKGSLGERKRRMDEEEKNEEEDGSLEGFP